MIHPTEQKLREALSDTPCYCGSSGEKECRRCAALAEPPIEVKEERKSGPSYFSLMKVRYVTPWKEEK